MAYILLILGFVLLVKGADFFVEGSSSVAKLLRIPTIIIGLTIVAFGTSAPELAVSISASLSGSNDIAVGNVIGSNIFNLMMVLGLCSLLAPMPMDKKILNGDYLYAILAAVVMLLLFGFDHDLSRLDGIILLIMFAYFMGKTVRSALKDRAAGTDDDDEEEIKVLSPLLSVVYIIGGMAAIVIGGNLVVDNASLIAASFGLSETLIGLTVVAFGTSLPELVTSMVASKKGENGLALGNVIGSNIFNIFFVLGASATVKPLAFGTIGNVDLLTLTAASLLFLACGWLIGKRTITRAEGVVFALGYVAYLVYLVINS